MLQARQELMERPVQQVLLVQLGPDPQVQPERQALQARKGLPVQQVPRARQEALAHPAQRAPRALKVQLVRQVVQEQLVQPAPPEQVDL